MTERDAVWKISFSSRARKQRKKLPKRINEIIDALLIALEKFGPIQTEWPHFGALNKKKHEYHCWLKAGHTVYVAVWQMIDKEIKLINVTYVGTHEDAPY